MLSILELEAYYQALQAIEDIKTQIEATALRAMDYEKVPSGNNYKGDTVGRIVTKIEGKSDALARLQIYVKKKRPDVEQTIAAAVAGMKGSAAVKIELALKMHSKTRPCSVSKGSKGREGKAIVPSILAQRYEKLQELNTARQLLAVIQASGIEGQDAQFISEKIAALEIDLSETEAAARQVIGSIDDMQARLFADIHFSCGYTWDEIGQMFHIRAEAAKSRVYRYMSALQRE